MKTIKIPIHNIVITLGNENPETPGAFYGGKITSDLREDENSDLFNTCMDLIESLILAHAVAGVDVESPAYQEGIETALEAIGNNV